MKRLLCLLLVCLLTVGLFACKSVDSETEDADRRTEASNEDDGGNGWFGDKNDGREEKENEQDGAANAQEGDDAPEEGGNQADTAGDVDMPEPTAPEEETTAAPEEPQPGAEVVPAMPYEDQIAVFAANYSSWLQQTEEFYSPALDFTVTDLNRDGRLELIGAACVGTGFFTYAKVWQVAPDGVSLEAISLEAGADLILSQCGVFYSYEEETYRYVMVDIWRGGWMEHGEVRMGLCWTGTEMLSEVLAYRTTTVDPGTYEETTLYYDGEDAPIDQTAYEQAEHNVYTEYVEGTANMVWKTVFEEDLSAYGEEDWYEILTACWQGFFLDFGE